MPHGVVKILGDYVAQQFGLPDAEALVGSGQKGIKTRARFCLIAVLRDRCQFGPTIIGDNLSINHATVIYGYNRANELNSTDAWFCDVYKTALKLDVLSIGQCKVNEPSTSSTACACQLCT